VAFDRGQNPFLAATSEFCLRTKVVAFNAEQPFSGEKGRSSFCGVNSSGGQWSFRAMRSGQIGKNRPLCILRKGCFTGKKSFLSVESRFCLCTKAVPRDNKS
jgi:hypothetical protein